MPEWWWQKGCVQKDWGSLGSSGDRVMLESHCLLWVELAVQSPPSWIANPFLRSTENILLIWNIREKKINSWIFNQKTKYSPKSYRELRNGSEEHEETFWSPPVRGTQPGTRQSSQGTEMDAGTESAFWKIRGERDPLDAENSIT